MNNCKYDMSKQCPKDGKCTCSDASECSDLLCCDICGGKMVYIRGRHPGMDNRIVCPTCMAETLDDIKGRLRDDYGKAYKAT